MSPHLGRWAARFIPLGLAGCLVPAYSPPAQISAAQTATVRGPGQRGASLWVADHNVGTVSSVGAGFRQGLEPWGGQATELQLNLGLAFLDPRVLDSGQDNTFYAARLGVRRALSPTTTLGLGLGGGAHTGGGFIASDLGAVRSLRGSVGPEVFFGADAGFSQPIDASPIEGLGDDPSSRRDTPRFTYHLRASGGLRFAFGGEGGLLLGWEIMRLQDTEAVATTLHGLVARVELAFD